jgi:tetratricopeptide (TPR) repeat protein
MHFERGLCALQQHDYAKAQQLFSTCIALILAGQPETGNSADATAAHALDICHYNRGLANVALHESEQAEADFTRALSLNPDLAAAWLQRGLLRRELRQLDAALGDLNKALKLGLSPGTIHHDLAITYRDQGDLGAAIQHAALARTFSDCPAEADRLEKQLQKEIKEQ